MLLLWSLLSAAGGDVLEARLEASVVGEATVEVRLEYTLLAPEGAAKLSFTAIEIGGSRIEDIAALEGDASLGIELEERDAPALRGAIFLTPRETSERTITLRYRVSGDAIPLLVLHVPSREARARTFLARVQVPEGTVLDGGFPSNVVRSDDGALVFELPVIPRFLSLRASPGRSSFRLSSLPGSFSGLFAVFGATVLLYFLWMLWVERGERD